MDGLETLSEAIERLIEAGYIESFRARLGQLESTASHSLFDPDEFLVDTIVRLEGITDLDEESAIFALTHPKSGLKGIYVVAYGPEMDTSDLVVVQKLSGI